MPSARYVCCRACGNSIVIAAHHIAQVAALMQRANDAIDLTLHIRGV
jgi:hypothetical protein